MNHINVSDFTDDMTKALEIEYKVLKIIQTKYPQAKKIVGNHAAFDIEVPGVTTVEVKHDIKSNDTDNFFVEYGMNQHPSGIEVSSAVWWVFVDRLGLYFIQRENLLHLLKSNHCLLRSLKGNDGTTILYRLIKKDTVWSSPYCSYMKRVDLTM